MKTGKVSGAKALLVKEGSAKLLGFGMSTAEVPNIGNNEGSYL